MVLWGVAGFHKSSPCLSFHLEDDLEEMPVLPCPRIQALRPARRLGLSGFVRVIDVSGFDQASTLVIST